jgi:hypothetical protein
VAVSFENDIKPLFRAIDIDHMKRLGFLLDDYSYMSDSTNNHQNAQKTLDQLSSHKMPPHGPFWSQDKLDLFSQWISDGYKP